jgi:hypothetical protein
MKKIYIILLLLIFIILNLQSDENDNLFKKLNDLTNDYERFQVFDKLSENKYQKAIPSTLEILKKNSSLYWQRMFIYGKYGKIAIQFLNEQLKSNDKIIIINSLDSLFWILSDNSSSEIEKLYLSCNDIEIKKRILPVLEYLETDLEQLKSFFSNLYNDEQDENLKKYTKETLDNIESVKEYIINEKSKKIIDKSLFNIEYNIIFNSYGTKGNYERLSNLSSFDDESKLYELKEKILFRNSDECFEDYKKVIRIIYLNRMIKYNVK